MRNGARRLILVVEDNADSRVIMKAWLEHAGFEVVLASDGGTGVRIANSISPDVILMDVLMPGMNGWAAVRELKSAENTRTIPVIALTALALPEDEQHTRNSGVDGYLAKPAELTGVLAEVERVLAASSSSSDDT